MSGIMVFNRYILYDPISMNAKNFLTNEMYYKAIEGSDSGLWVYDIQKGICFLSDRYYTMLGYKVGEFDGTMPNLFALLHPDDLEPTKQVFDRFFSDPNATYRHEVRLRNKSGGYTNILTQGLAERNTKGEVDIFIGWNIDVTQIKEAQKKLDDERALNISQSRLAQFGLLAGGLAHEVNNPLTVIQIRSEMIMKALEAKGSIPEKALLSHIDAIHAASGKIASIVNGLRTIADGGIEKNKSSLSLNEVLDEVLTICQSEILNRGIRLHLELPKNQFKFNANFSLVSQVILNLIKNAIDALEEKTEADIWIKIENTDKKTSFIIADNGSGISKPDREKIFLPFFTTKPPGKGTGLGLAISKSIVQSQNGELRLDHSDELTRFIAEFFI